MNKIPFVILAVVLGALISSGIVYLVLSKQVKEWQLVVAVLEERLATAEVIK